MDKENEKINELTRKQMEKVTGGVQNPDGKGKEFGLDCFICPGYIINTDKTQKCGQPLKQARAFSNVYRCQNGNCELCGKDQYPGGK